MPGAAMPYALFSPLVVLFGGLDAAVGLLPDAALLQLGGLLSVPGGPGAALGQLGAGVGLTSVVAGLYGVGARGPDLLERGWVA